jgi:spermidine/putrescine transport system substrate-binding protein
MEEQTVSGWRERELVDLTRELGNGRMDRRQFLVKALALGVTFSSVASIVAACGTAGQDTASTSGTPVAMETTKPDKLFFYCWPDESSPAVMKAFEKETGIKVVQSYYSANDMLLSKLKAGSTGYDMVMPSDWVVTILWKSGLLQPLDMAYIPNYKNQMPFFAKTPYDVDPQGNKYACTYMFGTAGIGVRTDLVKEKLTKWADLWNPAYKDKIIMLDDERATLSVGMFVLGYSPNTTDQTQLDAVTQKLIDQKPLVIKYDSTSPSRNIAVGTPITHCWDGNIVQAARTVGIDKIDYVLPEEGYYIWVDNLVIPKGAASPYGSHLLMNYLCIPENAAANSDACGYQTTIAAAGELLKDPVQKQLRQIQESQLSRGTYLKDVGAFQRQYDEAWSAVKAG